MLPQLGLDLAAGAWPVQDLSQPEQQRAFAAQMRAGRPLPRGPAYLHYKVVDVDPRAYVQLDYTARGGGSTFSFWAHRSRFGGAAHSAAHDGGGGEQRAAAAAGSQQPQPLLGGDETVPPVGVYFNASSEDGFFVGRFEDYEAVSRFDGSLGAQPWSLPDGGWRAEREWDLGRVSYEA